MIFNLNILVNNEHLLTFQERRYLFSLVFFKFPLPPLFFFLLPIIFLFNCKPLPSSSSSIEAFYSLSLIRINVSSLHKDRITCLLLTPVPACFARKQTFWNAALFTNSKSRQTLPVFFLLIANYNHSHDFDRLELIVLNKSNGLKWRIKQHFEAMDTAEYINMNPATELIDYKRTQVIVDTLQVKWQQNIPHTC